MSVFDNISIPKIIYEADSEFNGHLQVVEIGDIRKIKVDNIYQSISSNAPQVKSLVWGRMLDVFKQEKLELTKLLILGLGGGTMQHLFSKAYPGLHITSVDIDPVVVDIAKRFFNIDKIPNHKIIVDDALRVVVEPDSYEIAESSFDALIVDIYIGEKFPDLGKSGNFISALQKLVVPGGLIAFNRIYLEHHQDEVNLFIEGLEQFLKDIKCTVVAGYTNSDNVIITGRNG